MGPGHQPPRPLRRRNPPGPARRRRRPRPHLGVRAPARGGDRTRLPRRGALRTYGDGARGPRRARDPRARVRLGGQHRPADGLRRRAGEPGVLGRGPGLRDPRAGLPGGVPAPGPYGRHGQAPRHAAAGRRAAGPRRRHDGVPGAAEAGRAERDERAGRRGRHAGPVPGAGPRGTEPAAGSAAPGRPGPAERPATAAAAAPAPAVATAAAAPGAGASPEPHDAGARRRLPSWPQQVHQRAKARPRARRPHPQRTRTVR